MSENSIYRLDPSAFVTVRRRMLLRILTAGPVLLAGVWFLDGRLKPDRNLFDFLFLPVILSVVTYQTIRREQRKWEALVLEFRGDTLVRTLPDHRALEIIPEQVASLTESTTGLLIKVNDSNEGLFVSSGLVDYAEFRSKLLTWVPQIAVVKRESSLFQNVRQILFCVLLAFGIFGSPLYLMSLKKREFVVPLSFLCFAATLALILYARRSPHFPISKRNVVWVLLLVPLFPLFSLLLR